MTLLSDLEALRETEDLLVEALALIQEGRAPSARELINSFDGDLLFEAVICLCPDFMKNGDELLIRRSGDGAILRINLGSRVWSLGDLAGDSVVAALETFLGEPEGVICRRICEAVGRAYAQIRHEIRDEARGQ